MQIPNTFINGSIPMMVETNKGFIINGHYYSDILKNIQNYSTIPNFSGPFPYSQFSKLTGNLISFNSVFKSNKSYIVDNNDPDITYLFTNSENSNAYGTFLKLKETDDGKVEVLFSIKCAAVFMIEDLIYQNDNYILFINNDTTNRRILQSISKTTFVTTNLIVLTASTSYVKFLYETVDNAYFLVRNHTQILDIWKYNKPANTIARVTNLIPAKIVGSGYLNSRDQLIKHSDTSYTLWALYCSSSTTADIRKITFDFSSGNETQFVTSDINYTMDVTFPYINSVAVNYEVMKVVDSNNEYLSIVIYEGVQSSTTAQLPNYGIHVYKITDTVVDDVPAYDLVSKSINKLNNGLYLRSFIQLSEDNKTLILNYNHTLIAIAKWNLTTESYDFIQQIDIAARFIGIDKNNIVYLISTTSWNDTNTKITKLDLAETKKIWLTSTKTDFIYEGTNIEGSVIVHATDLEDQSIAATVDLVIDGNGAIFKSNNKKRIAVSIDGSTGLSSPIEFIVNNGSSFEIKPVAHVITS
jgi:hypothetical protein